MTQKGRSVANRILVIQAVIAIISALGFLLINSKAAYSALIGGIICLVPNLVFVIYAYRFGGARAAKKIASSFYRGEALKVLLTALLFAVTFITTPISIGPLMTTYVFCLLVFWFAPLLKDKEL
ncbi:MAG: ATP synthase protein I [Enterobacterales bacterium]|jgi:ATP synthase protein I